jgi:hypothetical protein
MVIDSINITAFVITLFLEVVMGAEYGAQGGFPTGVIFVWIAVYVFMALVLMGIAKKTNTPKGWLAWIPIANIFLGLMIARRPLWWFILLIIPLVNIIFAIIVWLDILKLRGKPWWWIILLFIPIVNIVCLAILAWGK